MAREPIQQYPNGIRGSAGLIWNQYGCHAAQREGWDLFHHTGNNELEIEVINCPEDVPALAAMGMTEQAFPSDDEAVLHVLRKAREHSPVHMLAVYLEGRNPDRECWVPSELLQPLEDVDAFIAKGLQGPADQEGTVTMDVTLKALFSISLDAGEHLRGKSLIETLVQGGIERLGLDDCDERNHPICDVQVIDAGVA